MLLPKAREILITYLKGSDEAEPVDFDRAVKVGAGAIDLVLRERRDLVSYAGELLPGETEE